MTTSPITYETHDATRARETADAPARGIDQARFAAGALLTAGVAVLTALVGIVVARGILHLNVFGAGSTLPYVLGVAGVALGAALLLDAVLHAAPHPTAYFGAIATLTTALAVAIPFAGTAALADRTVLAVTNLAVGAVIAVLLPLAAGSARR